MKRTLSLTLVMLFIAAAVVGCGRREYVGAPEERPGQPRQDDPRYRETETRAPYAVDVIVEE